MSRRRGGTSRGRWMTSEINVRMTELMFDQICVRVGRGSFSVYIRNLIAADLALWKEIVDKAMLEDPAALLRLQGDVPAQRPPTL